MAPWPGSTGRRTRDSPISLPDSDADLLFRPVGWGAVLKIIRVLERFQRQHHAPRLDGEIVLPDGDAIAWREISNHPAKVLAKGMNGARLRDMDSVRSVFEKRS